LNIEGESHEPKYIGPPKAGKYNETDSTLENSFLKLQVSILILAQ
jgi:hypothetical protein